MKTSSYNISEEKNVFDDHFLDIIGNEFRFDHEKGISEWLKNSVDAYITSNLSDHEQFILLKFTDSQIGEALFECIDFVGMSSTSIDKALKRWGDPNAAKRGQQRSVYGGHGNGGKFYMRQMFDVSYFITYKDGCLNIFGFSKNKKYGFVEGYKDRRATLQQALRQAHLQEDEIPAEFLRKIQRGATGFTVVRGVGPKGMKNVIKAHHIVEKLRRHPQSMRIMERIRIRVVHNNEELFGKIDPIVLNPLPGFEQPIYEELPQQIEIESKSGVIENVLLANNKFSQGSLTLRTSEVALTSSSKYADLNRIDIIGELGVIASYPLRELGLYYPQTDFIYGECKCPILEDPEDDCVLNDRTRLAAENAKTRAVLKFVTEKIKALCLAITNEEEKERREINRKKSSNYNNFLDTWKNKFMSKILGEILVGPGAGAGEGDGTGGTRRTAESNTGGGNGSNKRDHPPEGGAGTPKKATKFPRVLLSDHGAIIGDEDPFSPGEKILLQPSQGLIYQRPRDVDEGIYWINTSSPLAAAILKEYNVDSPRWRDYLFQRYVDIFIKEALVKLEEKEPERFNATTVDGEILGKLVSKIHEAAAIDLTSFLFEEHYEVR